jgi:short-subunit dehydrogenase involved in D-alanine esterification of teichoic acids
MDINMPILSKFEKNEQNRPKFNFHIRAKYGFYCTDFQEIHTWSKTLRNHLNPFSPKCVRNVKLVTVTEPIYTNTGFDRQRFVQNSHTEVHENTTESPAAHNLSPKRVRLTWSPHTVGLRFYGVKEF